jgi:hypothetical protein
MTMDLPTSASEIEARHDKLVKSTRKVMSDECGTMSAGRGTDWLGRGDTVSYIVASADSYIVQQGDVVGDL